ncbi:MAG: Major intrinsic protein [Actinomycetota bacterium]
MHSKRQILLWEFLGTFLIIVANLVTPSLNPRGPVVVLVPMVVGLSMVLTFYRTGAHLNPAVTGYLTVFVKIRKSRLAVYLIAEVAAALVGAGLAAVLRTQGLLRPVLVVPADPAWFWIKEAVATFLLLSYIAVFILLGIPRWTIAGVPVFLCLMQLNLFGGADMNPAVTIARGLAGYYSAGDFAARIGGEMLAMAAFLVVGHGLGAYRRTLLRRRNG